MLSHIPQTGCYTLSGFHVVTLTSRQFSAPLEFSCCWILVKRGYYMFGVFVLLHTARWIATLLGFSCCCTFLRTGYYSLKVSMLCNDVDNDDICMDDVGEDVDDVHANDPNQEGASKPAPLLVFVLWWWHMLFLPLF